MDLDILRRSICPISCALDILGDKWSLLIIRDMVFIHNKHFREFRASMEGIATNILTDRLKKLEAEAIIIKRADPNNGRQVIYSLTEKGKALIPVLVDLAQWGTTFDEHSDVKPEFKKKVLRDREEFIKEVTQRYEKSLKPSL